jgi:TRAP-type mannitol/chloroaromatic compound transport system substrate-binding protein
MMRLQVRKAHLDPACVDRAISRHSGRHRSVGRRRKLELSGANTRALAESDINNALALRKLRDEGKVKVARLDDSVLNVVHGISKDVVAEIGSIDELSKKIYASYLEFRTLITDWGEVSGRYLSSRKPA